MDSEEIQQKIIEVFENSKSQEEVLGGIYALFIPNMEKVEFVELHPTCGAELYLFIKARFAEFDEKHFPDVPAGALWYYKGFFPSRTMDPWGLDLETGIIHYKKEDEEKEHGF